MFISHRYYRHNQHHHHHRYYRYNQYHHHHLVVFFNGHLTSLLKMYVE